MPHVVLLGDSVFANTAYVGGGPDVVRQVRDALPAGWRATLCAVDGAVTISVLEQLHRLPPDASHLVVSIGGNDALRHVSVLDERTRSMTDALDRLAGLRERFELDYRIMLEGVLGHGLPAAVCTIYDGRFADVQRRRIAVTALAVFNDSITREAFRRGLPLIDLRLICDKDADYANPIEPSVQGGAKIARAIAALLTEHGDAGHGRSTIFAR
jgi:hypothetical protein